MTETTTFHRVDQLCSDLGRLISRGGLPRQQQDFACSGYLQLLHLRDALPGDPARPVDQVENLTARLLPVVGKAEVARLLLQEVGALILASPEIAGDLEADLLELNAVSGQKMSDYHNNNEHIS